MALSIEQALYRGVGGDGVVCVALVGTRVYPVQAPQQAVAPYVVYELAAGIRIRRVGREHGLAWRIDYGAMRRHTLAREVAAAVMAAINHRRVIQGCRWGVC